MPDSDTMRDKIVDTALALAERDHWEAVRLHEVATQLNITLEDLHQLFRDKEDLVEAWFDRADTAMLREAETPDFAQLPTRRRLHRLIMAWLNALAPHKNATRQMIVGRLAPAHPVVQVLGLVRVGRTVQWLREAARRDTAFMRRVIEESGLTAIFLLSFCFWMRDDSQDVERTSRFVDDKLAVAEHLGRGLHAWCPTHADSAPAAHPPAEEPTL